MRHEHSSGATVRDRNRRTFVLRGDHGSTASEVVGSVVAGVATVTMSHDESRGCMYQPGSLHYVVDEHAPPSSAEFAPLRYAVDVRDLLRLRQSLEVFPVPLA